MHAQLASDPLAVRPPLQLSARSAADSSAPATPSDSSAPASFRASSLDAARPIDAATKEGVKLTGSEQVGRRSASAPASKDLPPPVPMVAEPATSATDKAAAAAKIERPAHRKEGFSYSKAAGKSDGGVDEVTEGVEQAKLE
ncbi:hypothetical protein JCM10908_006842 [Rhodotorula pacifica]|uniref:uncharacterized protein n=1 Tax=Rhodotorula pacifica TaxID=1495444 RepID=UPI00316BD892